MSVERKNFLVTGYGRSGTDFLHSLMNRSDRWSVNHEARDGLDDSEFFRGAWLPEQISADFDRDYYGEVNSRLRYFLFRVPVDKVGVIIRDPQDIFLSVMNRKKHYKNYHFFIRDILQSYQVFSDFFACYKGAIIDFNRMTKDAAYCQKVIDWSGVDDVRVDFSDLQNKVNSNKKIKFPKFEYLPKKVRQDFRSIDWDGLVAHVMANGENL